LGSCNWGRILFSGNIFCFLEGAIEYLIFKGWTDYTFLRVVIGGGFYFLEKIEKNISLKTLYYITVNRHRKTII
jgi:hypothetical protein